MLLKFDKRISLGKPASLCVFGKKIMLINPKQDKGNSKKIDATLGGVERVVQGNRRFWCVKKYICVLCHRCLYERVASLIGANNKL